MYVTSSLGCDEEQDDDDDVVVVVDDGDDDEDDDDGNDDDDNDEDKSGIGNVQFGDDMLSFDMFDDRCEFDGDNKDNVFGTGFFDVEDADNDELDDGDNDAGDAGDTCVDVGVSPVCDVDLLFLCVHFGRSILYLCPLTTSSPLCGAT